jgi:hypothetical protein
MKMAIDFSGYVNSDLIPNGTIALVQMKVTGGDGADGLLTRTKNGDGELLKNEFTVLEGEYAKRKVFDNWIVVGTKDGQKLMAKRYLRLCKSTLASAKYVDPNDQSPGARAKLTAEWRDFDGLRFLAEIGIEKGKNGFEDKNVIKRAITRDMPQWGNRPPIEQIATGGKDGSTSGGASPALSAPPIPKPPWAD